MPSTSWAGLKFIDGWCGGGGTEKALPHVTYWQYMHISLMTHAGTEKSSPHVA